MNTPPLRSRQPVNQRRFVDAVRGQTDPMTAIITLASMMDDYKSQLQLQAAQTLDYAFAPILARALVRCRIGTLVSVNPNGTLSLADKATNQIANGVIVSEEGNFNYKWSALAILRLTITDSTSSGNQTLYLSNSGMIQATRPTTGTIQRVGFQYAYDAASASTLSLIAPGLATYVG